MIRYHLSAALFLSLALSAELPRAAAQPQVPGGGATSRGTFSPYLNLLGGNGRSPAYNYLGIVRPQQQLNQQFGQLQQQLTQQNQSLNQAIQLTEESLLPPTGNVSVFNSTGQYFNRIPGVSSGGVGGSSGGLSRGFQSGFGGGNSLYSNSGGGFSQPGSSRGGSRGSSPKR